MLIFRMITLKIIAKVSPVYRLLSLSALAIGLLLLAPPAQADDCGCTGEYYRCVRGCSYDNLLCYQGCNGDYSCQQDCDNTQFWCDSDCESTEACCTDACNGGPGC
jgi:hypothetical protein